MGLSNFRALKGFSIGHGTNEVQILSGSGSPLGVVTAGVGSLYSDYTNGLFYKKTINNDATGWEEISGASALSLLAWKQPTLAATTAADGNINLAGTYTGTIDGQTLVDGGRYLIKNQTNAAENLVYTWSATTQKFTIAKDFAIVTDYPLGTAVISDLGTQENTLWVITNLSPISWSTLGNYTASGGVKLTANNFSADLDAAGAIILNGNSLKVNTGNGIQITNNAITAVAATGGALTVDANGIAVNIDSTNGSTAVINNQVAVPGLAKIHTTLSTTPSVVDTLPVATTTMAEWLIAVRNGTAGSYGIRITAVVDNSGNVDYDEVSVLSTGTITDPVFTVTSDGTNLTLNASGETGYALHITRMATSI